MSNYLKSYLEAWGDKVDRLADAMLLRRDALIQGHTEQAEFIENTQVLPLEYQIAFFTKRLIQVMEKEWYGR